MSYSQVEFVLILHPKVFFGEIWSQKLEFSKLTEIWYRGTLKSKLCELVPNNSKIVIHNICLQLGKKLHLVL